MMQSWAEVVVTGSFFSPQEPDVLEVRRVGVLDFVLTPSSCYK